MRDIENRRDNLCYLKGRDSVSLARHDEREFAWSRLGALEVSWLGFAQQLRFDTGGSL